VPFVQADQARFEPPKADNALLGYLIGVLTLVSIFAFCMYRAMQPTVLANAGTAAVERHVGTLGLGKGKSVVVLLASRSTIDQIEQSELATALVENERQGLESVALASHKPQKDPAQKLAKVLPRTPAKPKRVVLVQRPDPGPFGQHAWAFGSTGSRSFGGFGSWYR
jgi:hypothetical protein